MHCVTHDGWYFQEHLMRNTTCLKELWQLAGKKGAIMLLVKDKTILLSTDLGSWEVPAKAGSDH